ncbi:carboxymuconolactone decarboxylase family protein [Rhodovulum sp. YNF3179]|uniref:carboxymuconolactone decarboxylase family protein n=1 Tax=Rhodovulum sp. YNF3179 TaxID=3425127 RepID=UPI003D3377BC
MDWTDYMNATKDQVRVLNRTIPETTKAFGALGKAVKETGALDVKTKEFVALGIAVADRCESCIGFHVEALAKAGATREEVADVLSMCVQMGGGPSLMYAAKALDAWDQLCGSSEARAAE